MLRPVVKANGDHANLAISGEVGLKRTAAQAHLFSWDGVAIKRTNVGWVSAVHGASFQASTADGA